MCGIFRMIFLQISYGGSESNIPHAGSHKPAKAHFRIANRWKARLKVRRWYCFFGTSIFKFRSLSVRRRTAPAWNRVLLHFRSQQGTAPFCFFPCVQQGKSSAHIYCNRNIDMYHKHTDFQVLFETYLLCEAAVFMFWKRKFIAAVSFCTSYNEEC